jgi:hypothetical protein
MSSRPHRTGCEETSSGGGARTISSSRSQGRSSSGRLAGSPTARAHLVVEEAIEDVVGRDGGTQGAAFPGIELTNCGHRPMAECRDQLDAVLLPFLAAVRERSE